MGCLEGDRPAEEQVQQLRCLVESAPEPVLRPYLEECACAFAGGAYAVATVAGWCAVARYLRLIVDTVGHDIAECFYRDEMEKASQSFLHLIQHSDQPFYVVCKRMRFFEDKTSEDRAKVDAIKDFYDTRNRYAHPNDESISANAVLDAINTVKWLLHRQVSQERFQTVQVVFVCARDHKFSWNEQKAEELVRWVCEDQQGTLANTVLDNLFATPDNQDIESGKAIDLWNAVKPLLRNDVRCGLMENLAGKLSSSLSDKMDVMNVARHLIFWDQAKEHSAIWRYLLARRGDLSRRIEDRIRQYAPSPYREQIDEEIEFKEDEI
ncbi:MAG: hypothetical protein FJ026_00465 [Chloroflexi bacterium]|nr:hypothetical protein [Chloroflexota bacterium]